MFGSGLEVNFIVTDFAKRLEKITLKPESFKSLSRGLREKHYVTKRMVDLRQPLTLKTLVPLTRMIGSRQTSQNRYWNLLHQSLPISIRLFNS